MYLEIDLVYHEVDWVHHEIDFFKIVWHKLLDSSLKLIGSIIDCFYLSVACVFHPVRIVDGELDGKRTASSESTGTTCT